MKDDFKLTHPTVIPILLALSFIMGSWVGILASHDSKNNYKRGFKDATRMIPEKIQLLVNTVDQHALNQKEYAHFKDKVKSLDPRFLQLWGTMSYEQKTNHVTNMVTKDISNPEKLQYAWDREEINQIMDQMGNEEIRRLLRTASGLTTKVEILPESPPHPLQTWRPYLNDIPPGFHTLQDVEEEYQRIWGGKQ